MKKQDEKRGFELAVRVLRQVAEKLQALSADECEAVLAGDSALTIMVKERRAESGRLSTKSARPEVMAEMRQRLDEFSTREDGAGYLRQRGLTKRELEQLARSLDLPVLKSDTAEKLLNKIIEATIGFRLRSEAVHGIRKGR